MPSKYLLSGWKKECMPSRFFSVSCEVTAINSGRISADLAALPVRAWHLSCCLPGPPRAVSGAEGHLQSGRPGGPPGAALTDGIFFSRNASPVRHPLQFQFIICIFPSVNYFRIVPSGPITMILNFEIWARHSEYS